MWESNVTRERLLQKISLLAMLGPIRERTKEHDIVSRSEKRHTLTIEQETEIVSNLTFLSYRRKDSRIMTAICIKKKEDGQRIVIRLAINGDAISHAEKGLRQICVTLEKVSRCGTISGRTFSYPANIKKKP